MTDHADVAAIRLLAKLRRFALEALDADERVVLALLLAPGFRAATATDDVEGFTFTRVGDEALMETLHDAVRRSQLRIVGFEDDSAT